jgi:histidine ammonia-lyase
MKKCTCLILNILCLLTCCGVFAEDVIVIGRGKSLSLQEFHSIVYEGKTIKLSDESAERLRETREFVDYLLLENIKVYGLTTGFADLRNCVVSPENAGRLSRNIIASHDAGIGKSLDEDIVLGAMLLRANSLAKGNSAFKLASLETLIGMVNARIVPLVPATGSLGASGDLAFLARLGRAMQGDDVAVHYQGKIVSSKEALNDAGIELFKPVAKEGLALTNGTSFMASMAAIAYLKEMHEFENILALEGLFLNSVNGIDAAFYDCIQEVRQQAGQKEIAVILKNTFKDSPLVDRENVQNDYCLRCLPQILGPKLEMILSLYPIVENELNAVTDNPLVFKDNEISKDVDEGRIFNIKGSRWAVISGGNFHGEYLASFGDCLALLNAKIALTMERQMTYMLNPARNQNLLPIYLINKKKDIGLLSGFMITQYTANALTQKICYLANPVSNFNITSANESEDIVSYGATSVGKLLDQLEYIHQLNTVYLTTVAQAYSIRRGDYLKLQGTISIDLTSESLFKSIQNSLHDNMRFPVNEDVAFDQYYEVLGRLLETNALRKIMDFPVSKKTYLPSM